jgi:O-antigen/teichoic acid export membrane protein
VTRVRLRQAIRRRGVRDTLLTTLTGVAGQLAVLVGGIVAARVLGVEDRGHFAQIFLVALILSYLGSLGVPLALTYYIASDHGLAAGLTARVTRFALAQMLIVLAVQAGLLVVFFDNARSDVQTAAAITLVTSVAALTQQYGLAVLQGLQRFTPFNLLRLAPPALYAAGAVFVWVSGRRDIIAVAIAYTAATVVAAALTTGYA